MCAVNWPIDSLPIRNVIPAERACARESRNPRAGKGTGNFLEDEKVVSPQLDSTFGE